MYAVLGSVAFLYNLALFIWYKGHPLLVVTSGVTILEYSIVFYLKYKGELWKSTYICVPYFLTHAVAAVCCYR